jgi:hypothetical protein
VFGLNLEDGLTLPACNLYIPGHAYDGGKFSLLTALIRSSSRKLLFHFIGKGQTIHLPSAKFFILHKS